MTVDQIFQCDSPDCDGHTQPLPADSGPSRHWIIVYEVGAPTQQHFCGWTCAMKYAAAQPEPVRLDNESGQ